MQQLISTKIREIAESIITSIEQNDLMLEDNGLYFGDGGVLLFLSHYLRYSEDARVKSVFDKYTESFLEKISNNLFTHTFCSGISGVFYLLRFVNQYKFLDIEISEAESSYESFLNKRLEIEFMKKNHDFMHGALGIGFYFLENLNKQTSKSLHKLVDQLEIGSIKTSNGRKWESLYAYDEYKYDFGLAHGMSSIIIFLSKILKIGINGSKAFSLLTDAVNLIISDQIDHTKYNSHFPDSEYPEQSKIHGSRLAWCHGDLGICLALWQAGRITCNKQWTSIAINVLKKTTLRKDLNKNGVIDAGFCHGASGIAQIFLRMYHETLHIDFLNASNYWIAQTLNMAIFNDGAASYKTLGDNNNWIIDHTLLTGISGIGLVLISSLGSIYTSEWDKIFLLH